MVCDNNIFSLEELHIVGGDYKEFPIHIYDNDRAQMMDVSDLELNFSMLHYSNRYGKPLITKDLTVSTDDSTAFLLILMPEDTRDLAGQYIYQISVKAPNDKQESFQGILLIEKNLNPDAFTS